MHNRLSGAVLIFALLASASAQAEKWYFEPSFDARLGYDDNVRFTSDFEDSAFSAYLKADARFGVRTEVSDAKFGIQLDTRKYQGESDLDVSNQFYNMDLAYKAGLNTFRLRGDYNNDSTRTSELLTTGFLSQTIPRTYRLLNPSWERVLTERASMQLGYTYSDASYDDDGETGLVDYSYETASLVGNYEWSERTQLQASLNFSMYDAKDVFSEYKSYWLQFGAIHRFSETLKGTLMIGPRYTRFDFRGPGGIDLNADDDTYLAELRLHKSYETWNVEGVLRSFESPSSSGRLLRTKAAELNIDGRLSARTGYSFKTGFYRNSTSAGLNDPSQDRDYFFLEPRLSWRATRWWRVTGSYRYRSQDYTAGTAARATSNSVFLTINYIWPRESLSRWMAL